jgi:hypothetical protein
LIFLVTKFTEYIEKWKDEYEDGEHVCHLDLMQKAEHKYQAQIMTGEWNALSKEQEEIIALKANLATLKGLSKPNKHPQSATSSHNKKQQWLERPKVNDKAKGKPHQKQLTGKQHWQNTKPLPHEPTTKTVDGST